MCTCTQTHTTLTDRHRHKHKHRHTTYMLHTQTLNTTTHAQQLSSMDTQFSKVSTLQANRKKMLYKHQISLYTQNDSHYTPISAKMCKPL